MNDKTELKVFMDLRSIPFAMPSFCSAQAGSEVQPRDHRAVI